MIYLFEHLLHTGCILKIIYLLLVLRKWKFKEYDTKLRVDTIY